MLNLLIVGVRWPPETFLDRLILGLADEGIGVTIASRNRPLRFQDKRAGLGWIPLPSGGHNLLRELLSVPKLLPLGKTLASQDIKAFSAYAPRGRDLRTSLWYWRHMLPYAGRRWDVIYFPWNATAIRYLGLFDLGCPVVISCRGSLVNIAPHNPTLSGYSEGLRDSFQRATAIHCVSNAILAEAQNYGLDPVKAVVIRPAVDCEFFQPLLRSQKLGTKLNIVTTGSLIWRKGYEYALLALRRVLDSNVCAHLEIIGDGPERQRLLYTIHDLGLSEHVTLMGKLAPIKVRERLQEADAFLFSSLSEGIPNAVLEAMACGLPIVTTDCGGIREVISDGVEGFVVPLRDPDAMADALIHLAASNTLQETMGANGRSRVVSSFAFQAQLTGFTQLLHTIAQDRKPVVQDFGVQVP